MCGVPVWTWIRHTVIIQGLCRKLRAWKKWNVETVCINVSLSDFQVYLHGLASGISQASKESGRSWEDKNRQMSSPCVFTSQWFWACLFHLKYTCNDSGCQTEYVWGTCMDWNPGYLQHRDSLTEVESVKWGKCWDRVYKREFQRFLGTYSITSTHVIVVVATDRICVGYLCGMEPGIPPVSREIDRSWDPKHCHVGILTSLGFM